jgi:hypothetical protein
MRLGKRQLLLFTPLQDCAQSGGGPLCPSILSVPRKPSLGLPPSGNLHGVFDLVEEACFESIASAVVRGKDDHLPACRQNVGQSRWDEAFTGD